jgi:hypothetical protein
MDGVGAQGQAQGTQAGMGNAAAQDLLSGETWRGRGNLRGNPPVQNEAPPNMGIVEDEAVYKKRRTAAGAQLNRQRATADSFLGNSDSPMDNRYWFARVYSLVTEGELQEASSGAFFYPSYALQCVRYFDQIYQDNVKAADTGEQVEAHWERAFEVCADEDGYVGPDILDFLTGDLYRSITSLVISMQAHIRYDLPRAEAWVFQSYYSHMDDAKMADFGPDFMSMMDVFERAAAQMNKETADLHHLPADMMPRSMQDVFMSRWFNADMATERAVTWQRSEALVDQGLVGADPYSEGADGMLHGDITRSDNLSNVEQVQGVQAPYLERDFLSAAGQSVGLDGELSWNPVNWGADSAVRSEVSGSSTATLGELSPFKRAEMMRRCASGVTFDGDEITILKLIRASERAGELVVTIDAAVAFDLLSATDGTEYTTMRDIFKRSYYPSTSMPVAMAYIRRCMVGMTNEWHEEMIMDILSAKKLVNSKGVVVEDLPLHESQAAALIEQIGLEFEGGGYEGGLIELEEQVDGAEEAQLHALFGAPRHDTAGDTRVRQMASQPRLKDRTLAVRVSMVKRLLEGATFDADEATIIKILHASRAAGDLVSLIDTVGAHDIGADVDGSEWVRVRAIFRSSYYAATRQSEAFKLLNTCIVGSTDEWEEEMIADLICLRNDGRQLILRLGGGEGFDEGLNVLEWNLDGEDQSRVERKFGSSGKWW